MLTTPSNNVVHKISVLNIQGIVNCDRIRLGHHLFNVMMMIMIMMINANGFIV